MNHRNTLYLSMENYRSSDVYLLDVPNHQKQWFRVNYETLKHEVQTSEAMDYSMLENNIFGINERFIDWQHDSFGLLDEYISNHVLQEEKTSFIVDCLICALEDCKTLEYYEMAHNLNLIIMPFDEALSAYLEGIKEWSSSEPF